MGIGDKLKKARSLGIAGTVKMAAVKWKKAERSDGSPAAPGRRVILDRILSRGYKRIIIFERNIRFFKDISPPPLFCGNRNGSLRLFIILLFRASFHPFSETSRPA